MIEKPGGCVHDQETENAPGHLDSEPEAPRATRRAIDETREECGDGTGIEGSYAPGGAKDQARLARESAGVFLADEEGLLEFGVFGGAGCGDPGWMQFWIGVSVMGMAEGSSR